MRFEDLEWGTNVHFPDVPQAYAALPNGYEVSIIRGERCSRFMGPDDYELMEYAEGGWPPLEETMRRGDAAEMQKALDEIAARPPRKPD